MGRTRERVGWRVGGGIVTGAVGLLLSAGCGDDGTAPDPGPDDPLATLFVVAGDAQAAVTGRLLPDSVRVNGLLDSGAEGFFGPVGFDVVEGDGTVEVDGATATGPGSGVVSFNRGDGAAFAWRMGTPDTPHRVRAWAVRALGDTVEAFITATSVEDAPLDRFEVEGDDQSAIEGQMLPDTVRVRALLANGFPFVERLHVELLAGDGEVDLGNTRGGGPGATLIQQGRRDGVLTFVWTMGAPGEHRVRVYGLRSEADTVSVEVAATSLPGG